MYRLLISSGDYTPKYFRSGMALSLLVVLPEWSGLMAQQKDHGFPLPWHSNPWFYAACGLLALVFLCVGYLWRGRKSQQQVQEEKEEALRYLRITEEYSGLQKRHQMLEDGLAEVKKQLRSKTIALVKKTKESDEKGRILQTLKEEVDEITQQNTSTKFEWRKVSHILGEYHEAEDNNFSVLIEELHQDFLARLNEQFPNLTTYDQRLCVYLKSGLTTREIAELMGVLPSSVNVSRSRLRKKLKLAPKEDLYRFLKKIE